MRELGTSIFVIVCFGILAFTCWAIYHRGFKDGSLEQLCTDNGGELIPDNRCVHVTAVPIDGGAGR
jgi:hypothetical protein